MFKDFGILNEKRRPILISLTQRVSSPSYVWWGAQDSIEKAIQTG